MTKHPSSARRTPSSPRTPSSSPRRRGPSVFLLALLLITLLPTPQTQATPRVELEGLMPNAAVILVDGQRKLIKTGQTFNGVKLIAAYSKTATLEIDGKETMLGISRRVGTNYQPRTDKTVTIRRDEQLQYITTATINGRRLQVLVDTGANILALNRTHAQQLGINLKDAPRGKVETASGQHDAWKVSLNSVDVGGIKVNNVMATVLDGNFPSTVLLGMTYLKHVKIEEHQGIMTLTHIAQ